jgi:hypothetical protein
VELECLESRQLLSVANGLVGLDVAGMTELADAPIPQYDLEPHGSLEETRVEASSADVLDLSPDELASYVASQDFDSLRFLWTLDDNVRSVFTDAHILRVSSEFSARSALYDGTNTQHLRELLFFVRVAHYHGFYDSDLDVSGTRSGIVEDFDAFSSSPHLNDLNTEASQIVRHKHVLSDYSSDPLRQLAENSEQASTVYSVMVALGRTTHPLYDPQDFFDAELLDLLTPYTTTSSHQPHDEYLVNNAIWTIGQFARVDGFQEDVAIILTDVMDTNSTSSTEYLWAVKGLELYGGGQNSRGEAVSMDTHRDDADALLFPNSFSFDDGSLVIQTPLELDDAQSIFDAVQDVKAQFQIIADTSTPVPGDSNEALTAVVYGSIEAYQDYQPVLNDLSTSNGGIYIEQDGTFYTYERTPDESSFTLEELFRHEYVHYLVGRFVFEGDWGSTAFYSNNRLVWFDEGFAEFLAGSTADGVTLRSTNIADIENDGTDRLTINELVNSTYGDGFKFYRYGGAFFSFLHDNHTDRLSDLLTHARTSDITNFDLWVDDVQDDEILEEEFQDYLDGRIDDLNAPQVFTVDTNTDISDGDISSGNFSLREAIDLANVGSGHDTILFDASLVGQTISLGGTQLAIENDLTIDGLGAEQLAVSGNNASRVFSVGTGVTVEISGLTITGGNAGASGGNARASSGGGIDNRGTLTISRSTISDNTAAYRGGGVYNYGSGSALTIIDSTISANATVGDNGQGGGGIKFYGSTVTITNSTVSGNTAVRFGGGISNSGGDLTIIGSTLANNSANETGGGIHLTSEAVATITNSTLSGNTGKRGGAIGIRLGGSLRLINSTLTGNSAGYTGGGIHNAGATTPVELANTLVANNHNNGSPNTPDISGEFTSHGNNLIGFDGSATGFTNGANGDLVGTGDAPIDPLLGPLANNGGQTRTHALLEGSPAINAARDSLAVDPSGSPLATDQRGPGFDRNVSGSVDIGAFEVTVSPVASITLDADDNCTADLLTDGILIARYLAGGYEGNALTDGAVGEDTLRPDATDIVAFLEGGLTTMLDVDDNGAADLLTDGILIARYLAGGYEGNDLTDGAVGAGAARTDPEEIIAFLDGYMPGCSRSAVPAPSALRIQDAVADGRMLGGDGNDFLRGHGGSDTITGGNGDDRLHGDAGNDRIDGNTGDDLIRGGDGADLLTGGDGDDVLRGGHGNDILVGGEGHDTLYGAAGNDILQGDDGKTDTDHARDDDRLDGGTDGDTVRGGGGSDVILDNPSEVDENFAYWAEWVDAV